MKKLPGKKAYKKTGTSAAKGTDGRVKKLRGIKKPKRGLYGG